MYATKTNDHYRAFPLWQQLASHGNTTAKYNLGLCYHNGWGTAKDDSQALYWWRQAAAEGHADAQSNARILEQEMQGGIEKAVVMSGSEIAFHLIGGLRLIETIA